MAFVGWGVKVDLRTIPQSACRCWAALSIAIYAMWWTGAFEIIAGSFNAGFGQALTFDDRAV